MNSSTLSVESIDQACSWMARLWADDATEQDHKDCEAWRNANPTNEAAWQQVQQIRNRFETLPDPKAGSQLLRRNHGLRRRQLLGFAGLGLGVSFIGAKTIIPQGIALTDYATSTGEMANYTLVDGTQLILNTATRVNVDISDNQRAIHLLEGEIWIATGQHRLPLTVVGRDGLLIPLGTEFTVRQFPQQTRLCVYQGQVQIIPASPVANKQIIAAGEGSDFTADKAQLTFTANSDNAAWTQGKLAVADMPLAQFIAEISRYRRGLLRLSPELPEYTVTGVFSLNDTDRILNQLREILPVTIRRITPWWVTVLPT